MNFSELPSEIQELIPAYSENRAIEHQHLLKLLTSGNIEDINRIGHKLAGNAGSYGMSELGEIGERLENSSSLDEISQLLVEYEKLLHSYKDLI